MLDWVVDGAVHALVYWYPAYRTALALLLPVHVPTKKQAMSIGKSDPELLKLPSLDDTSIPIRFAADATPLWPRIFSSSERTEKTPISSAVDRRHRWLAYWLELVLLDVFFAFSAFITQTSLKEFRASRGVLAWVLMAEDADGAAYFAATLLLPLVEGREKFIEDLDSKMQEALETFLAYCL